MIKPPLRTNSFLAALPPKLNTTLLGNGDVMNLVAGHVLYQQGGSIRFAYFPMEALISLHTVLPDARSVEAALVGHEGVVGVALGSSGAHSQQRAIVQVGGRALRMEAGEFGKQLAGSGLLRQKMHDYTYALMNEIAWTAACNHFHPVDGRLARRLLMMKDRVGSRGFHLTQEVLARVLGVRRVGITTAASALQRRKVIAYQRGRIRILNQSALETASCPCYVLMRQLHDTPHGVYWHRHNLGWSRRTDTIGKGATGD